MFASGFTFREIDRDQQEGLPYPGWTAPQFRWFLRIAARSQVILEDTMTDAVTTAIGLAFADKKNATKLQRERVKRRNNA